LKPIMEPTENVDETRNPDGTFRPGHPFRFTAEEPRPGPGRPRKDAWVRELERLLEDDPGKGRAMAREVYRIATEGEDDKVRLAALKECQDRTGGPVVKQIELDVDARIETRAIMIMGAPQAAPQLPESVRRIEQQRAEAEDKAQVRRKAEDAG
jgi:hypothetical protein